MLGLRSIRAAPRIQLRQRTLQLGGRRFESSGHQFSGAADNAFNRERQAVKDHAAGTSDFWRRLSIYIVIPALFISGTNAWRLWDEHWEHKSHEPPVEERTEYPFMNVRNKAFPWGDGDKTLFWNEAVNHHKKGEGE